MTLQTVTAHKQIQKCLTRPKSVLKVSFSCCRCWLLRDPSTL